MSRNEEIKPHSVHAVVMDVDTFPMRNHGLKTMDVQINKRTTLPVRLQSTRTEVLDPLWHEQTFLPRQ